MPIRGRYVAVDCISGEWEIGDTIDSGGKNFCLGFQMPMC